MTAATTREQHSPVAEKEATGIGSPDWSGDEPHSESNAAFLSRWHVQFWAAGREEPQGSPVLHRYFRLPFGLPSQSEVGSAVTYRNWSIAMELIAHSASAHIPFSVFTVRESNTIKKALSIIEEKRLRDSPVLYYFEDFQRYLVLRFAGLRHEQAHVLYLDADRRLLSAEVEADGTHRSVGADFRRIALNAITLGADSIVFAHNHPNDNPNPSDSDLKHFDWLRKALQPLSVNLLDSYVVTSRGINSISRCHREIEDERNRQMILAHERRSAERSAKIAATKAAKRAVRNSEAANA